MSITSFDEGKFYVMTPPGHKWVDYEGPFHTPDEALEYLGQFVNKGNTFSPEMLGMVVVRYSVYPDGGQCSLARASDGSILNGEYLYWKGNHERV